MASLTVHLLQPGDHGGLAFHPECPVCRRDRLSGTPPQDAFVSRRTKALLAAGVVAVWSASPTAGLATEPDQEEAEAMVPDQVAATGSPSDPVFDPGGADDPVVEVPVTAAPAPTDPDDEAGPVEQEPATDEVLPIVDPGDRDEVPDQPQEQEPEAADPTPTPTPAATPPAPDAPPSVPDAGASPPEVVSSAPAADTPVVPPAPERHKSGLEPRRELARDGKQDRQTPSHPVGAPAVPAIPAPQPQPVAYASAPPATAAPEVEPAAAATVRHEGRARRVERVHVVQRNESLWSIAKDLLGKDASAARIAREVNRLWELNSGRIGTGDPDLLLSGTRLVVR